MFAAQKWCFFVPAAEKLKSRSVFYYCGRFMGANLRWLVFSWPELNKYPVRSGAVVGVPADSPPADADSRCVGVREQRKRSVSVA